MDNEGFKRWLENALGEDPSPQAPGPDPLFNLLVERQLRAAALPTKYVGYVDMLGFGALVRVGSVDEILAPRFDGAGNPLDPIVNRSEAAGPAG